MLAFFRYIYVRHPPISAKTVTYNSLCS